MEDIAVIILTFNEEQNLSAALESVKGWANTVFVVDSYSTDGTIDIALSRAPDCVSVVQHHFENYSAQWNWAVTHLPIQARWTMKLDADERLSPVFKKEVTACIRNAAQDLEGIYVRYRLTFMGATLHWGAFSSTYLLRLWRTGRAICGDRSVNEHFSVKGRTCMSRAFLDHCNYKSFSDWIDKHNRYSSMEAMSVASGNVSGDISSRFWGNPVERRAWLRRVYSQFPGRAFFYFLYRYVVRLGFLDGRAGFRFAFLHAAFMYWIDLKILEYQMTNKVPDVIWPTRGQPDPLVAGSELQKLVDRN